MTAPKAPEPARIVEVWDFDGTEQSVRGALDKYPELKFVWRGGGESFVSWRVGNKLMPLKQGKLIVRMSDGTFSRRSAATLARLGVRAPASMPALSKPTPVRKEKLVRAWLFDGTPESVREALEAHASLHFVQHEDGNYLLWEKSAFRYRVRAGQCLAELDTGELVHRQRRVARQAGLIV